MLSLASITLNEEIDDIVEDPIETTSTTTTASSGKTSKVSGDVKTTTVSTTKVTTTKTTKKVDSKDSYIGILEVPDVNIKRGFLSLDSKYNSIKYNVTLIKGSSMPDVDKGNLILAAHRGTSKVSYFENLYKLKIGSLAYVTYQGKKYTYKLLETYEVPKTGTLTISRDGNKTALTLITCTRNNKKTQTIFNYELISVK